jgi:hypothetical protein
LFSSSYRFSESKITIYTDEGCGVVSAFFYYKEAKECMYHWLDKYAHEKTKEFSAHNNTSFVDLASLSPNEQKGFAAVVESLEQKIPPDRSGGTFLL